MRRVILVLLLAEAVHAQVRLPGFTRREMPNGVTVILCPKTDVPMITLRAMVRGGTEADPAGLDGAGSLMLEMLRRGTNTRTAAGFADQLDFLGARWQAHNDRQSSSVTIEFLAKDAAKAVELWADALARPAFAEEEFRKALAEKLGAARAVKDQPGRAVGLYYQRFFFGANHPYSRLAEGDELSLAAITRNRLLAHYRTLFRSRNTVVMAVGRFDPAAFGEILSRHLSTLPEGPAWTPPKSSAPAHASPRLLLVDKPGSAQTYFRIGWPGIDRTHPDRVPLLLVNTLFGGRFTSMLNQALRTDSGLSYGASSIVEENRLPGAIQISTFTKTETTAEAVTMALDVLKRLHADGIDAAGLASAKAYVKGAFPTDRLETNGQVAAVLGELALFGLNRGEIDDLFSRIDAVTVEQANATAKRYFTPANPQFCLVGDAAKIRDQVAKFAAQRKEIRIADPGFAVPAF